MIAMTRIIADPPASPESEVFYKAAAEGVFLVRRCTACHRAHWYPREHCPHCSGPTEWEQASGRGSIYSYTVMRRVDPPYVLAYVSLAEGPAMLTNIIGADADRIAIGQAVILTFIASSNGTMIPCFSPDPAPPD